jgi:translocation and assembly module TamA
LFIGRKVRVFLALSVALAPVACLTTSASAFDFFGFWGDDAPPPVSQTAIAYKVSIDVAGGDSGLVNAVKDASSLYKLRQDAPPDGDSLARRAMRDFSPIVDALWGAGYYDAKVMIAIDQASLEIGATDTSAFAKAAEAYRNAKAAPIRIAVDPGPLFTLRSVRVVDAASGLAYTRDELPQKVIGLKPGDPAAASDIRAAMARIVDYVRAQGHPLVKVQAPSPIVDHVAHIMDLTLAVAPGPRATLSEATIVGPQHFDPLVARSFLYLEPGDPYSPKALADARTSIRNIPAVGSVRVTEADHLDAQGQLPYQVEVVDRAEHAIGASAAYSTIDGPNGQLYWEDRNLFGGAERLRLEGDLLYAPPNDGLVNQYGHFGLADLGWRVSASFLKPALGGTRNDLLVDALDEHASTNTLNYIGYTVSDVDATAAIRHRFTDAFSIQIGIEGQTGVATDVLGKVDYTIIGVPIAAVYDTTDSKLDPTRGVRVGATLAAYPTFLGSTLDLFEAKGHMSTYYSLDEDSRYVLAGRVAAGSLTGSSLDDIPANLRFYSGGGGSVRGYAYDSLGPLGPNNSVIGGRSLFEASAEVRIKVTDTIGVVPFFDAGNAFAANFPDFKDPLQMAAGLGLRYYTAIGPIRVDIATPINRRSGDKPVAVYVSVGQAF